ALPGDCFCLFDSKVSRAGRLDVEEPASSEQAARLYAADATVRRLLLPGASVVARGIERNIQHTFYYKDRFAEVYFAVDCSLAAVRSAVRLAKSDQPRGLASVITDLYPAAAGSESWSSLARRVSRFRPLSLFISRRSWLSCRARN